MSKEDPDIDMLNNTVVLDTAFVKYSDNIHGDKCYISTENTSTEFEQYVYIKKYGDINIRLNNSDSEVIISFGSIKMFTVCNSFNYYNPDNKVKFEILQDIDNSDVVILKTKVPVGNIYSLYIQNDIYCLNIY